MNPKFRTKVIKYFIGLKTLEIIGLVVAFFLIYFIGHWKYFCEEVYWFVCGLLFLTIFGVSLFLLVCLIITIIKKNWGKAIKLALKE